MRKTKIDWRNPITRGLVFAAPTSEGLDAVTGLPPVNIRANNRLVVDNFGKHGNVIASGGSTSLASRFYSDKYAQERCWDQPGLTMWSLQRHGVSRDTWECPFGIDYNNANTSPYYVGLAASSGNNGTYIGLGYSDESTYRLGAGSWPGAGSLSTMALRFNRFASPNRIETFINGSIDIAQPGSDLNVGWPSEVNSNTIGLNDWDQVANQDNFSGSVALAAIWSRALSDSELRSMEVNPWQVFEQPRIPLTFRRKKHVLVNVGDNVQDEQP